MKGLSELKDEMKNEAKLLIYLNENNYKWAPRLLFTGSYRLQFYINATQLINGTHKQFEEMSHNERNQLKKAIDQLHSLHILHNDLYPKNIIFSENGGEMFIIDYGLAEYSESEITWKDEMNDFVDKLYEEAYYSIWITLFETSLKNSIFLFFIISKIDFYMWK